MSSVVILAEAGKADSLKDVPDALRRVGIAGRLVETEAGSVRIPLEGHKLLESCDKAYVVGEGPALDSARAIAAERSALIEGSASADTFAHVGIIGEAMGRKDLDQFLIASATGPAALAKWKEDHASDPLAMGGFKMPSMPKLPPLAPMSARKDKAPAQKSSGEASKGKSKVRVGAGKTIVQALILTLCHFAAVGLFIAGMFIFVGPGDVMDPQALAVGMAVFATPLVLLVAMVAWRLAGPLQWRGTLLVEALGFLLPGLIISLVLMPQEQGATALWVGIAWAFVTVAAWGIRVLARRLYHRGPKWLSALPFLAVPAILWAAMAISDHVPERDDPFARYLTGKAIDLRGGPGSTIDIDGDQRVGAAIRQKRSRGFFGSRYEDTFYVPVETVAPGVTDQLRQVVSGKGGRIFLSDRQGFIEQQDIETLGEAMLAITFDSEKCAGQNPCAIPMQLSLYWPQGTFDGAGDNKALRFDIETMLRASEMADAWDYDPVAVCGFDPREVAATRLVTDVCWGRVAKIMGRERQIDPYSLLPYSEESLEAVVRYWAGSRVWINEEEGTTTLGARFEMPFKPYDPAEYQPADDAMAEDGSAAAAAEDAMVDAGAESTPYPVFREEAPR